MHSKSSSIRTHRAATALAALLAGALALTACSGGDDKKKDDGGESGGATGSTVTLPKLDGANLEVAAV